MICRHPIQLTKNETVEEDEGSEEESEDEVENDARNDDFEENEHYEELLLNKD